MYKGGDKVVTIKDSGNQIMPVCIGSVGTIYRAVSYTNINGENLYWVLFNKGIYLYKEKEIKPYNEFKKKYLLLEQILNNI